MWWRRASCRRRLDLVLRRCLGTFVAAVATPAGCGRLGDFLPPKFCFLHRRARARPRQLCKVFWPCSLAIIIAANVNAGRHDASRVALVRRGRAQFHHRTPRALGKGAPPASRASDGADGLVHADSWRAGRLECVRRPLLFIYFGLLSHPLYLPQSPTQSPSS